MAEAIVPEDRRAMQRNSVGPALSHSQGMEMLSFVIPRLSLACTLSPYVEHGFTMTAI